MKTYASLFFFLFSTLTSANYEYLSTLMLGPISSGGGMGVVCTDSSNNITSVELLDLWEARKLYNRKIKSSNKSVQEIALKSLENLKNSIDIEDYFVGTGTASPDLVGSDALYDILKFDLDRFLYKGTLEQIRRLRGVELTLTDDSFEVIKPTDCEIKQLIRYIDNAHGGEIIINQDLVDKMDNLNLAALYLHEAFYAHLRDYGEQSSIRVRRAIGLLFSGYIFKPWNSFLPNQYYKCENILNKVFIYLDGANGVTYAISRVGGRNTIGFVEPRMWIEAKSIEEALSAKSFGLESYDTLGFKAGNDFSYRLFAIEDEATGEIKASLELTDAPDFISPQKDNHMKCSKVIN